MDDVPAAPGTRTEGNKGGNYALAGPNWNGTLPPDVKEIRLDTSLLGLGGRTYTAGPADYPAVHKIQDQYKLTPLSKWGTDYAPPETVPVAPDVDPRTPVGDQVFRMPPEEFFGRLNELLVNNPPRAADVPVMERIAKLGIKPGATFSLEGFDPEVQQAIADGWPKRRRRSSSTSPRWVKRSTGGQWHLMAVAMAPTTLIALPGRTSRSAPT
jgi:hypothetical protein